MLLNGKKPGICEELIVLPRIDEEGNETEIVFKARAILDMSNFERLCPEPTPPSIMRRGGGVIENTKDKHYLAKLENHNEQRIAYMVIKSLEATEGLEWENVDIGNSDTWLKYKEEFREAGLSDIEIGRIVAGVVIANSCSNEHIEQAKKHFLAKQREMKANLITQREELLVTSNGDHANDSE